MRSWLLGSFAVSLLMGCGARSSGGAEPEATESGSEAGEAGDSGESTGETGVPECAEPAEDPDEPELEWTYKTGSSEARSYEGYAVAVGGDGSIVVTGQLSVDDETDGWIAKFDELGCLRWSTTFGRALARDFGSGIAVDGDGSVVVVGTVGMVLDTGSEADVWIARYSSDGELTWSREWDGAAGGDDHAWDVVIDSQGAIVVGGNTSVGAERWDALLRKLSSDGSELWTTTYDGTDSWSDIVVALAIDSADAIIVGGRANTMSEDYTEVLVAKYAPDGELLWAREESPQGYTDVVVGVVVDATDGVLALADTNWPGAYVLRLSPAGDVEWMRSIWEPPEDGPPVTGMEPTADGNLLLVGTRGSGPDEVWTAIYSPEVELVWYTSHAEMGDASGTGVAGAAAGRVVVCGNVEHVTEQPWSRSRELWLGRYAP